jgi:hypothetical protein
MFLYHTKATHELVRQGFTELDTWRKALGDQEPLLVFADRLPMLNAPEYLASGHTSKHDFTIRG